MQLPKRVYVATEPVDMRLSFDRLAGVVRAYLNGDPRSDALFVFHNRRRTHLKLLWHDGSGYVLLFKRLDRRRFRIPETVPSGTRQVEVSARELRIILKGIDPAILRAARRAARAA